MFVRVKKTGRHEYLQIVENRREGPRTVQRLVATIGRLDELKAHGDVDTLVRGLSRFTSGNGRAEPRVSPGEQAGTTPPPQSIPGGTSGDARPSVPLAVPGPAPAPSTPAPTVKPVSRLDTAPTRSPAPGTRRPDPAAVPDDVEWTEEFNSVLALVESGRPVVFVTGAAGTGKTTLVHLVRGELLKKRRNVVVVAPTGVAALNVGGQTIHSFFRFPPHLLSDDDVREVHGSPLYSRLDLLIIDEVSMVRADMMDAIDRFLRLNGRSRGMPFGGTPLLLVGDLYQLPPVVKGDEATELDRRYDTPYFFSAPRFRSCPLDCVELTKVFRQRDPVFADLLGRLRVGKDREEVVREINGKCSGKTVAIDPLITLNCTNDAASRVNKVKMAALPEPERLYRGVTEGEFRTDKDKLPSPENLRLRCGAQVMFTKNDANGRWVNGSMGVVTDLRGYSVMVRVIGEGGGKIHEVERDHWERFSYRFDSREMRIKAVPVGTYTQIPLMLAWAVTIHKSQGKTLERVLVDLGDGAFANGQAYVALSRCRSFRDLALKRPLRMSDVMVDRRITAFHEALRTRTQPQCRSPGQSGYILTCYRRPWDDPEPGPAAGWSSTCGEGEGDQLPGQRPIG